VELGILKISLYLKQQSLDEYVADLINKDRVTPIPNSFKIGSTSAPEKTYLDLDEWEDVTRAAFTRTLRAKEPVQVHGYLKYHESLVEHFPMPKHKNWRRTAPSSHLKKAIKLLKKIDEQEEFDLAEVHAAQLHLYFLVFNTLNGTRNKKKPVAKSYELYSPFQLNRWEGGFFFLILFRILYRRIHLHLHFPRNICGAATRLLRGYSV
jgi:hypothetical protein